MDLFFKRDCADGAGPAVELASPVLEASPADAAVGPPALTAGAADEDAWAVVPAGLVPPRPNSDGAAVLVDAAPVDAGALPPAGFEKNDGPDVEVAAVFPVAAEAVEAPGVADVDVGALPPSLGKLNPVEAPPAPVDPAFAAVNKLVAGAPVDAAADLSPPRLRGFVGVAEGCDEAG